MGINIELYKYNWDRLTLSLKEIGIGDTKLLEKILLSFGERCGNRYYILNNECHQEYNSYYNMISFIQNCFDIEDGFIVGHVFVKNRKVVESARQSEYDIQEALGLEFEWKYR